MVEPVDTLINIALKLIADVSTGRRLGERITLVCDGLAFLQITGPSGMWEAFVSLIVDGNWNILLLLRHNLWLLSGISVIIDAI